MSTSRLGLPGLNSLVAGGRGGGGGGDVSERVSEEFTHGVEKIQVHTNV